MDALKKKYSEVGKKRTAGSRSRRRIFSAQSECQSTSTAQITQLSNPTQPQSLASAAVIPGASPLTAEGLR